MDDEGAIILASGLVGMKNLKNLKLNNQ